MTLFAQIRQFKQKEPILLESLVQKGVISIDVVNRVEMYDFYTAIYQGNRRMRTTAISQTALKFKCSEMTVRRAIDFMES